MRRSANDASHGSRRGPGPAERPVEWTKDVLTRMDWKRFEALTAAYYTHLGYRAETMQCGPDGGIDVKLFRGDAADACCHRSMQGLDEPTGRREAGARVARGHGS